MKKSRNGSIKIIIVIVTLFMLTGFNCSDAYWNYDCVWYSENPYIYMPSNGTYAIIELEGNKVDVDTSKDFDGTAITFYKHSDGANSEEDLIWDTKSEIKDGKLYLTIIKDNVSDYEGKTIVLEQIELEETEDTDK